MIINDVVPLLGINILRHTYLTGISLHVFMTAAEEIGEAGEVVAETTLKTFKERFRDDLQEHAATDS